MRRERRPAAALSPTTRPRLPSNALPSTMNSGTHQPKIIHWWLLSVWRLPGKYCDKALMNYNLSNLVFCPLLLILSGISLSWLLCAGLWTGYPPIWHLTSEFLCSGSFTILQRWDRKLQIRKLELHFLNWLSKLAPVSLPQMWRFKKKRNPSSFYCGVCVAVAASDKLDVRVSEDKVTYLTNWCTGRQYVGQVSEITEANDLLTHVFLCTRDKNRSI